MKIAIAAGKTQPAQGGNLALTQKAQCTAQLDKRAIHLAAISGKDPAMKIHLGPARQLHQHHALETYATGAVRQTLHIGSANVHMLANLLGQQQIIAKTIHLAKAKQHNYSGSSVSPANSWACVSRRRTR